MKDPTNPYATVPDAEWQRLRDSADFYEWCAYSDGAVLLFRLLDCIRALSAGLARL